MKKHTIDAAGKKLGRIASEAANALRGKNSPDFSRTELPDTAVEIVNASKLSITEKQAGDTEFTRYSGYPGGFKIRTMKDLIAKRGYGDLLRKTVYGMLPKNRMRAKIIKKLTVKE